MAAIGLQAGSVTSAAAATPLCGSMAGQTPHITKVLWIVMENRSYGTSSAEIPGDPSAAYIDSSLLSQCGSASDFHAETHPSYPNYLAMTSGGTQGVTTDTLSFVTGPSIFSQVDPSWRGYEEFMPAPCDHVAETGTNPPSQYYIGRHNPAASYSSLPVGAPTSGDCATNDVAMGTLTSGALQQDVAAGALPRFSMVTPGACDDMHALPTGDTSCPDLVKGGDTWLSNWVPAITSGPDYTSGNLMIDITWDEGRGGSSGENCVTSAVSDCVVPDIVISPYTPHVVSSTDYSHYSLLKTTEELLGVSLLGHAGDPATNDMCTPFGLCAPSPSAVFSSSCSGLSCVFDGGGSSEPGGSIVGYSWAFGDGGSGSGVSVSHVFGSAGSYPVTLTVTDGSGVTASVTHQVVVAVGGQPIAAVGSVGVTENASSGSVMVPAGVVAGDALVLVATGVTTSALTAPAGWTLVGTEPNPVMTTQVWSKVATGSDAGSTVTVGFPAAVRGSVQLSAYSGTSLTAPVVGFAGAVTHTTSSTATTPTVTVPAAGDWLVSYWTVKSSAVNAWTAPAGVTSRSAVIGTGGGRVSSLLADSGGPVATGTAGGFAATTDQPFSASTTLSLILAAA
jgi:PKD domain/Phosphoesterase family